MSRYINMGGSVKRTDADGNTPLHITCMNPSYSKCIQLLLNADKRVLAMRNGEGNTPLHCCAMTDKNCVEAFLTTGADRNATNNAGQTAYALAQSMNSQTFIQSYDRVIAREAEAARRAAYNIFTAAQEHNERWIESAIRQRHSVNVQDSDGNTPLHIVCGTKNVRMDGSRGRCMKLLLKAHPGVLLVRNHVGNTPLHCCAMADDLEVETLLTAGADRNALNNAGQTAYDLAQSMNSQTFIQSYDRVIAREAEAARRAAYNIFTAAQEHNERWIESAIRQRHPVNVQDSDGNTPLHIVCGTKNVRMDGSRGRCMKLLLKAHPGALLVRNHVGNTPLHCCAMADGLDLWDFLGDHANRDALNNARQTAYDLAQSKGNQSFMRSYNDFIAREQEAARRAAYNIFTAAQGLEHPGYDKQYIEQYIRAGYNVNCQDGNGNTPLHIACEKGKYVCEALIERSDLSIHNNAGDTALNCAVKGGSASVVNAVLRKSNAEVRSAAHDLAVRGGNADIIKQFELVPAQGTEPPMGDQKMQFSRKTLLMDAVQKGDEEKVRALLEGGANPNIAVDYSAETALHFAAQGDSAPIVKVLIAYGAEVNLSDLDGKMPISYALAGKNVKIMQLLCDAAADSEILAAKGCEGISGASGQGMLFLFNYRRPAPVQQREVVAAPVQRETFLSAAAANNWDRALHLLQEEPDFARALTQLDGHGRTILHLATAAAKVELVRHLLNFGADPRIVDQRGNTPISLSHNPDIISLLQNKMQEGKLAAHAPGAEAGAPQQPMAAARAIAPDGEATYELHQAVMSEDVGQVVWLRGEKECSIFKKINGLSALDHALKIREPLIKKRMLRGLVLGSHEGNSECSVCFETRSNSSLLVPACGHQFCNECVNTRLILQGDCPCCQQKFDMV